MIKLDKQTFLTFAISLLIVFILFGVGDFVWYKNEQYTRTIKILELKLTQERQRGHLSGIYYENELNKLRPPDINVPEEVK